MRKVTAGLFHSVDGVVSDPYKFQFDSFDDELGEGLTTMMDTVDTVVLGRVSYQEWAAYWPNASVDEDFSAFINPVEKHVASRTLTGPLEWQDRKSTRLNSSHANISYAVFCLKKKKKTHANHSRLAWTD